MKEKSTNEILSEFAKQKDLKFYTNSSIKKFHLSNNERFASSKFVVFDLQDQDKNTFFVFFDDYASKAFTSNTFCGIFKLTKKCKSEMNILKRDWFDLLSFNKRIKTGSSFIDKNVTVFSEEKDLDSSILNTGLIKKYLEMSKRIMPLEIATIKNSASVVPELNGKDLLSLTTNSWIYDPKELEFFIEQGRDLIRRIS